MATDPDVIVIGSGVLGSSMAYMLAGKGFRVTVIERDLAQPDRIIGELLQPGGVKALHKLGLQDCLDNLDGHIINGYIIHDKKTNSRVEVPYHMLEDKALGSNNEAESNEGRTLGSTEGIAFHHGRFVMALREAAMSQPKVEYIEANVTKLLEEDDIIKGVCYTKRHCTVTQELRAPLTVVADGCFSKFRKGLVKNKPSVKSHFIGVVMENCPQAKLNHAELVLSEANCVLIYRISTTCTRILVDVRGDMPPDVKQYLVDEIHPQLPEHIQDPFMDSIQNCRIRSMPNSYLAPAPIQKAGVLCLGDAFNMRHPLTGGGMSVAFNDVALCQDLFDNIPDLHSHGLVLEASNTLYSTRKGNHSFVVDVLSMALYELFAANDDKLSKLKCACLEYFQRGGECIRGPVGLLSVMKPRPDILIYHFFAVCIYAMAHTFRSHPWWAVHRAVSESGGIFYKACSVILPLMWSELKS